MRKPINLTGRKINNWNIKYIDQEKKQKHTSNFWVCECDCGKIMSISAHRLLTYNSKGCSQCFVDNIPKTEHKRIDIQDIKNKEFGRLKILQETKVKNVAGEERRFVLCICQCGNEKEVILKQLLSGDIKDCGCRYYSVNNTGRLTSKRKKYITKSGYVKIYLPDHSNTDRNGYVLEHVLVMSDYLKRPIQDKETIHHKNGVRSDNRLENLELWSTHHAFGQRAEDLVVYAKEILEKYNNYKNPTKQYFICNINSPVQTCTTLLANNNYANTFTVSSKI